MEYMDTYPSYRNLRGERNTKTPLTHPYNYDSFVNWENNYVEGRGSSVYSDRLYQWDWEKFNNCSKKIFGDTGQYFNNRKPEDIEKFLSLYLDKKIELTAIIQCCNQSTGYPYWCFYYNEKEKELERE